MRGVITGAVIIPAHNESAVIGRLLSVLTQSGAGELRVVVVCNGCSDDTASIARSFAVEVLETPVASKIEALRLGDSAVEEYPRLYVDADVELDRASIDRLLDRLRSGKVLAAGPRRVIPLNGASPLVKAYYQAWEDLPAVKSSLWGRGVVGFAREAGERVQNLPTAMSDDLAMSLLFAPEERDVVTSATVVIHPPRTLSALLIRKRRSVLGNRQLAADGFATSSERTKPGDVMRIGLQSPGHAIGVSVLMAVAIAARLQLTLADLVGAAPEWGRDETSRSPSAGRKGL